jgi:phosphoribosylglycinamide formyltransferase 1
MYPYRTRLAVPVSGTGSILQAMIAAEVPIDLVFADRQCKGVEIARHNNIPVEVLPRSFKKSEFGPRARFEYTKEAVNIFRDYYIDLIAMAGFMTVWDPIIFAFYERRVINIHPSLLPLFKGDHAVRDAHAAKVSETGTTVHYATEVLDDERWIIRQERVPVRGDDTVETLHERIKVVERTLYPAVVRELLCTMQPIHLDFGISIPAAA